MQKVGNYEYSKLHGQITAAGFLAGVVYGIAFRKGIPAILMLGVAGGLLGFGAGTLIDRPVRVTDYKNTDPEQNTIKSNFKTEGTGANKPPKCNCKVWDPHSHGLSFSPGLLDTNGVCIKSDNCTGTGG